jgi:hypothetical protein
MLYKETRSRMDPTRINAIAAVLLTVAFAAGALVYAAHPEARDDHARRTGVLIMAGAAALFMAKLAGGEAVAAFRAAAAA